MFGRKRHEQTADEVFVEYGQTMLAVQLFEWHLAFLRLMHDAGDGRSNSPRHTKKQLLRILHATQRASASESRNQLKALLDPDLIEEITRLIGWRDQLAHSYLHERLRREGDDLVFAEGTAAELRRLHDEFEGACLFLEEQLETISADLTDDLASIGTEDAAALEALARKMFQRTPRN